MSNFAEIMEQYLEDAVEVKNKKILRRYVFLLTNNIIQKSTYRRNNNELKSDIKVLAETMKEGFKAVDKRFEDMNKRFEDNYKYMDKRFEDMNKRFNMMFTFMNIGFGIIILVTILFKFMQ